MPEIIATVVADRVTPGAVRFTELEPQIGDTCISIYLRKEMVSFLGLDPEQEGTTVRLKLDRA